MKETIEILLKIEIFYIGAMVGMATYWVLDGGLEKLKKKWLDSKEE